MSAKISEATNIDAIQLQEQASVTTAASGYGKIYFKSDGKVYANSNTLSETDLTGGGGSPDASTVTYTPTTLADWDSDADPGDLDDALDQLAERVDDLEGASSGGLYTSIAILRDEKSTTTAGGSSSNTTWNARDLNTELYDPDSIVTISSNQFTPISGDYEIYASAPSFVSTATRLRLYNVTGTASVEEGTSHRSAGTNISSIASLTCKFTANGTDAYRIDHYTSTGRATDGLGSAVSDGSSEVYLVIVLRKLS